MYNKRNIKFLRRISSQKIRNFLFSNEFREFLFFLFFVFIASVFWLLNTLNYDHEREIEVYVTAVNLPKGTVLVSDNPQVLKVKVKDKGIKLLNNMLKINGNTINYDISRLVNRSGQASVSSQSLLADNPIVSQQGTIISCFPDSVRFNYASAVSVKLPVVLKSDIVSDDFHYIKNVAVSPDSVVVNIPDVLSGKINCVETELLTSKPLSESSTFVVDLKNDGRMKLQEKSVMVKYTVGIFTDYSLKVPVKAVNFPLGYALRTFPSTVTVSFLVGMDDISRVDANDFQIVLDYNKLKDLETGRVDLQLKSMPSIVHNVRLSVETVEFLIEKQF